MERLLARLAVRPPESHDGVFPAFRHVGVEVVSDVDELVHHLHRLFMQPHHEIADPAIVHLGHHLVPGVIVQRHVLLKQLRPRLDDARAVLAGGCAANVGIGIGIGIGVGLRLGF